MNLSWRNICLRWILKVCHWLWQKKLGFTIFSDSQDWFGRFILIGIYVNKNLKLDLYKFTELTLITHWHITPLTCLVWSFEEAHRQWGYLYDLLLCCSCFYRLEYSLRSIWAPVLQFRYSFCADNYFGCREVLLIKGISFWIAALW